MTTFNNYIPCHLYYLYSFNSVNFFKDKSAVKVLYGVNLL